MRYVSCLAVCLCAATMLLSVPSAHAAPLSKPAAATDTSTLRIEVHRRGYRSYRYYDEPIEYYRGPMPSVRVYRYTPPPVVVYEPPVYGWIALPPPPSSCGRYRYWNGERCADARYDPPYVGPRW